MHTIDPMLRPLIIQKNPEAPKLIDIVEKRCIDFAKRFKQVKKNPHITNLAARMDRKHHYEHGYDYMMFHHQPMKHDMALMCQRYGMDEKQWPDQFSPEDLTRLIAWENGERVPKRAVLGEQMYVWPPFIAGGAELTDYFEAELGNGLHRTGMTTTIPWATGVAKVVGNRIRATVWDDTIYEVVAISGTGTTGGTEPTWSTGIGAETTDNPGTNQIVWQAKKIGVLKSPYFYALFTASPGETGGGTEVSGGNYARVPLHPLDTNYTASVQVNGAGRNDNAVAIQYGAPSANWGTVTDTARMHRLTGGNMETYTPLNLAKTINNGDAAPSFAIGAFGMDYN